MQLTVTIHGP
ncbi:hypothetical protein MTR67_052633 [Solanum verrucosum]|uniref:Uncharacterized protein n=1 Tax=Solanum verrucosum TaxID=315347 RepID=A0AAF0V9H9_SOLVR|nr:hypothetical protein MTR67_052633 [Solanum verrucosum]